MESTNKTSSIIIGIIAISLIAGAFYYSTLQNKTINETPIKIEETTANKNTETDTRILLTAENNSDYHSKDEDPCNQLFNQDKPNTTVQYSNTQYGLSFDVPFNSNWGNTKYKIEPYWQQEDKVEFGAIEGAEACGWMRAYEVKIKEQQDAETLTKQITDELSPLALEPTTIKINGLTVVKYDQSGFCSSPVIQVIGEKYNYEFGPNCGDEADVEFKILEDIIKTIKLI